MMPLLRSELDTFARRHELTGREQDVLFMLLNGQSSVADIATGLNLSRNTVHNHFKNMFRRTGAANKASLMALFIRETMGRQAQQRTFLKWPSVLLVGQERAKRKRLVACLTQRGMRVYEAQNGELALSAIADLGIDVVVADGSGPELSDLSARVVDRFGRRPTVLDTERLESGVKGLAAADAEGSQANEALVFGILECFVDSPYQRSRLVRVDTDLRGRIDTQHPVTIANLSFGGAFIQPLALPQALEAQPAEEDLEEVDEDPPEPALPPLPKIGTSIELSVELPVHGTLTSRGRVVWLRKDGGAAAPRGFGIAFVRLTAERRRILETYVRRHKLSWLARSEHPAIVSR